MTGLGHTVPPVKHTLGAAKFEPVNTPPGIAGGPPPVDVHDLLRANLAREKAVGLHELKPLPPRRSRRKRDYWFSLAAGNTIILLAMFLAGSGLISLASGLAGMVLFSCGLTWIIWVLLDDY